MGTKVPYFYLCLLIVLLNTSVYKLNSSHNLNKTSINLTKKRYFSRKLLDNYARPYILGENNKGNLWALSYFLKGLSTGPAMGFIFSYEPYHGSKYGLCIIFIHCYGFRPHIMYNLKKK